MKRLKLIFEGFKKYNKYLISVIDMARRGRGEILKLLKEVTMKELFNVDNKHTTFIFEGLLFLGLYLSSFYNYLLFHLACLLFWGSSLKSY